MKVNKFFTILVPIAILVLSSIYGLGQAYYKELTPTRNYNLFSGIHPDRWIEQGAKINLPHLGAGNKLHITWYNWLPDGIQPRVVKLKICDMPATEVLAIPGKTSVIELKDKCSPYNIEFEFVNPFLASAEDTRIVGAQLKRVKVASSLGQPTLAVKWVFTAILFALLLSILLARTMPRLTNFQTLLLASLLQLLFLMLVKNLYFINAFYAYGTFWIFLTGIYFSRFSVLNSSIFQNSEPKRSKNLLLLFFILLVAAVLRFYGLNFGLPDIYHPDEIQKYRAVMRMVDNGDLNPRYFWHPTLLLYSTYFMNSVVQIFSSAEFTETLIYSGRLVSCLAGIASVFLVFLLGRQMFSRATGLWAAAILAILPIHITCSRYLKEDALLTFFVLLAVYLTVKAAHSGSLKILAFAALVCGFSASVKYSGVLTALCLLGYPWFRFGKDKITTKYIVQIGALFLLVPFGFLITSPYALLDFYTFAKDFNHEREHMLTGHSSNISAASQLWMFHVKRSIIPGQGWLISVFALAGLGLAIRTRFQVGLYLAALVLLFYLPAEFVRAKPAPQPERYILPCLPFLAIAASYFVTGLKSGLMRSTLMLILLVGISMSGYRAVTLASEIPNDTRQQMADWINNNLPAGSKIMVDWQQYGPQLTGSQFTVTYLDPNTVIMDLNSINSGQLAADYLVLSSLHYDRYFSMPNSEPSFRQVIRDVFSNQQKIIEFKPKFGTYGFHNPKLSLLKVKEVSSMEQ